MKLFYAYSLVSLLTVFYMIFILAQISRSKVENKKFLVFPIVVAVAAVLSYSGFLLCRNYLSAMVFNEIYYVCTDWMTFALFNLFTVGTSLLPWRKKANKIFFPLALADSVSMMINTVTKHNFELLPSMTVRELRFWWLDFSPMQYVHLAFCYVMVLSGFATLVINAVSAPKFYKKKYVFFLVSYLAVILANFHSYTENLPVDYSVVLYGVFASCIAVCSIYTFPNLLVGNVMGTVSEAVSDAIVHFDFDGKVIYQNVAAKRLFDPDTGFINMSPVDFKDYYLENPESEIAVSVKSESGGIYSDKNKNAEKNSSFNVSKNSSKSASSSVASVSDAEKNLRYFKVEYQELLIDGLNVGSYIKVSDKTDEKLRYQEERFAATHDELTGLYNRDGFFERIESQLKKGVFRQPLMICSNIKDFKLINDNFGEMAGDEILLRQASMMEKFAHSTNINARLNDDKFAIFMEKENFNQDIFMREIENLAQIADSSSCNLFISVGVYEVQDINEKVQIMYDKAKLAMDSIRNDYQKTFAFYSSNLMDRLLAEKNIINNFEDALESGQFEMYLQPIVDEKDGVKSAEALVRWNNPERGIMMPAEFIEVLDRTGLIYKLDKYICEKAVSKIAEWKSKGYKIESIAFNVNSKDEYYFDTLSFLKSVVEKYKVAPDSVILEMKEDALIDDYEGGSHYFEKIRSSGFKIAIDNFGSGYSSLNMLKDFSIDAIKISADFFSNDDFSDRAGIILSSIIEMVKELKIDVATVGIETLEQKNFLLGLGCTIFQGYLFSRPLPADEFEKKFLR